MAVSFTIDGASDALRSLGFFCEQDPIVGARVAEITQKRIPFLSEDGLEFCQLNILNDERVRSVLESFFPWCALARYRKFHSDPGHIFQFRKGGEKAGRHVLVVQLWDTGSKAVYYSTSHQHALPAVKASNGLWEVPFAALERAGCSKGFEYTFEHGGLSIQDARLAFELRAGTPIATVFATEDVIMRWTKMILPNTPEVVQKIANMGSQKIGLHVQLEPTNTEGESSLATQSASMSSNALKPSSPAPHAS